MRIVAAALGLIALAGCGALPRDPDGTTERIARAGVVRVGLAPGATADPRTAALLHAIGAKSRARVATRAGATEPLLVALDAGRLDLVVGWFSKDTPWVSAIALAPALAARGEGDEALELRAAARNGENRWVMLVETESRRLAQGNGS